MKRLLVVFLVLGFTVSASLALPAGMAPLGFGAKYAAMGGAGAAIVDDITAAYYNPAGIVRGGSTELRLGAQTATDGMNQLIGALTGVSDPARYMTDNFANAINVNGGINLLVGLEFADVGLSVMPVSTLSLNKAAGSITGTLTGQSDYDIALTLGRSFSIPNLPIASLDLGANVKSANRMAVSNTVAGLAGTGTVTSYSGLGFDIGAKAQVENLPIPLSVGLVMKDISSTLKGKVKTNTTTYNASDGSIASTTVVETDAADYVVPVTTSIGLATEVPLWGLKIALQQDSVSGGTPNAAYSLTHYGLEYPIVGGLIALRAGKATGASDTVDQTTLGVGINVGLGINIAMMTDAKNSKNNQTMIDFGFVL